DPDTLRAVADIAGEALDRAAVGDAAAAGQSDAGARLADDRSGVGDAGVRRERLRRQFVAVRVLAEEIGGRDAVRAAGDVPAGPVGDARSGLRDNDAAAGAAFGAADAGAKAANLAGIVDGDRAIVGIDANVESLDIGIFLFDHNLQRFGLVVMDAEGLL